MSLSVNAINDTSSIASAPYTVDIASAGKRNFHIQARTPRKLSMSFTSHWVPIISGGTPRDVMKLIEGFTGISSVNMYATGQVWIGTQPIRISLPLELIALTDPIADVVRPIKQLATLVLPNKLNNSGQLSPPGPLFNNDVAKLFPSAQSTSITIKIGKFLYFTDVIMNTVSPDIDLQFDTNGNPLRALVTIEFSSYYVATVEYLESVFPTALG